MLKVGNNKYKTEVGGIQVLERLSDASQEHFESVQFTYYLQFQLHRQLLAVSNYAAKHHIALKGDLPIGQMPLHCSPDKQYFEVSQAVLIILLLL